MKIFKNIKNQIAVCPRCGSAKVKKEITPINLIGASSPFTCTNCSFQGHLFPQIHVKDLEKFQEDIKKTKNEA